MLSVTNSLHNKFNHNVHKYVVMFYTLETFQIKKLSKHHIKQNSSSKIDSLVKIRFKARKTRLHIVIFIIRIAASGSVIVSDSKNLSLDLKWGINMDFLLFHHCFPVMSCSKGQRWFVFCTSVLFVSHRPCKVNVVKGEYHSTLVFKTEIYVHVSRVIANRSSPVFWSFYCKIWSILFLVVPNMFWFMRFMSHRSLCHQMSKDFPTQKKLFLKPNCRSGTPA